MKNKLLLIASMGLCVNVNAQELANVNITEQQRSFTLISPLINQKKVQEEYQKRTKIYTLDFSTSISKAVNQDVVASTSKVVKEAAFIEYSNKESINDLLTIQPDVLTVVIPFKETFLTIDLVKVDLFGDEFHVNSNLPEKVNGVKTGLYYQGMIRGENSLAGFSFFENEFNGLITTNRMTDRIIEIGKVENSKATTHLVYSDDDLLVDVHHSCGSDALEQYQTAVDQLGKEDFSHASTEKAMYKCVTYFWETSYNLYQSKGSSQAVTNYMTSLFNNFQLLYSNEQVGSKLNQLYIWTTPDSYNNSLYTFSSNRTNFGANLATLFSTTGGGGVAWLDALCGSNEYYKHGFCGSVGQSFSNVPNYSWPVNVTAHEVGHNLGSPHTHACSWSGGAIDGCGPAAGYSEGCNAAMPSNGGTIMSYCHLVNVGVNLSLGFGSQPGNLIRNRVNSCVTLTCDQTGGSGGGGSTCTTAFEPNETQNAAISIVSGTTISAAIATATEIDFYKITTSSTSNITFTLSGPNGVDYDLYIYNNAGAQVGSSTGQTATENVVINNLGAGMYFIKIMGYGGQNSAVCYTFKASAVVVTNCTTAYEPNESISAATPISLSTVVSSAIATATDNDYFKVNISSSGTYSFNLNGPTGIDLDVIVYNSSSNYIGTGTSTTSVESVTLSALPAGTYYIRVYGYNGAVSNSCYTLNVAKTGASFSDKTSEVVYSLWPNPATDKLMIQSSNENEKMKIDVVDINGKILSKHELMGTNSIDINNLQSGIYFIRIAMEDLNYKQLKFVKL
jgi:hypothetical protein